jgi:hypothetical protein
MKGSHRNRTNGTAPLADDTKSRDGRGVLLVRTGADTTFSRLLSARITVSIVCLNEETGTVSGWYSS